MSSRPKWPQGRNFGLGLQTKLWPRPQTFGLGLASISLSYYVIRHLSGKYRVKFQNFVNFSGNNLKSFRILLIIIWYFFIIISGLGLGLNLQKLASASSFWPRLKSLTEDRSHHAKLKSIVWRECTHTTCDLSKIIKAITQAFNTLLNVNCKRCQHSDKQSLKRRLSLHAATLAHMTTFQCSGNHLQTIWLMSFQGNKRWLKLHNNVLHPWQNKQAVYTSDAEQLTFTITSL